MIAPSAAEWDGVNLSKIINWQWNIQEGKETKGGVVMLDSFPESKAFITICKMLMKFIF